MTPTGRTCPALGVQFVSDSDGPSLVARGLFLVAWRTSVVGYHSRLWMAAQSIVLGGLILPARSTKHASVEAKVSREGKPIRGPSQGPPGVGFSWANLWKCWGQPDPADHQRTQELRESGKGAWREEMKWQSKTSQS